MEKELQNRRKKEFFDGAFQGMNEVGYRLAISEKTNQKVVKIGVESCFGHAPPIVEK